MDKIGLHMRMFNMIETTNINSLRHQTKKNKKTKLKKTKMYKNYLLKLYIAVTSKAISVDGFNKTKSTEMYQVASLK